MPLSKKTLNKTCQCALASFPSPPTAWELLRGMTAAHSSPRPLCPAYGHGERAQRGVFRQQDRRAVNWKTLLLPVSTPRRDFRDVSNESLQHIWDCPLPFLICASPCSQIAAGSKDPCISPMASRPQARCGMAERREDKMTSWKRTA